MEQRGEIKHNFKFFWFFKCCSKAYFLLLCFILEDDMIPQQNFQSLSLKVNPFRIFLNQFLLFDCIGWWLNLNFWWHYKNTPLIPWWGKQRHHFILLVIWFLIRSVFRSLRRIIWFLRFFRKEFSVFPLHLIKEQMFYLLSFLPNFRL